jgi:hypothetical protein
MAVKLRMCKENAENYQIWKSGEGSKDNWGMVEARTSYV